MSLRIMISVFTVLLCGSALNAQTMNPVLSGYVKAGFSSNLDNASETDISNARFKIAGSINDRTSYTVFVDGVRDDILLDAFVAHNIVPSVTVQIGQFKTAYSTENLIGNAKIAFIDRPYMKSDVAPAMRDKGIQFTYTNRFLDAFAGLMNGSGQNKDETNNNKSFAGRVVAKVLPQLNISGNYYTGTNATDSIGDEFFNIGANGNIGALEYSGEYARKDHGGLNANAWFAWFAYDVRTGMEYVKTITPAVRIESSDPDTDSSNDARSRYTFGLSAHLAKKYTDRIMINYELRDSESGDTDDLFGIEYTVIF